ncbi:hypothetical protein E2562_014242 [Oryza meyeriana var. granulata]|uniref:Uncharacterized protein n=1 Tax=Oryza meyeriana var. granulata TaxID=110450 RepID=A0A6G1BKF5_9ORYZ|nr:hypothetical protein E2562_014242 [Oryza meyeriana var. granulata]
MASVSARGEEAGDGRGKVMERNEEGEVGHAPRKTQEDDDRLSAVVRACIARLTSGPVRSAMERRLASGPGRELGFGSDNSSPDRKEGPKGIGQVTT